MELGFSIATLRAKEMVSSILLRRISSSLRSGVGNRMVTTCTRGGGSFSPAAPWLLMTNAYLEPCDLVLRFYCCADDIIHNFISLQNPDGRRVGFVGSSHGWLASYDYLNHNLFLTDPTTDRHVKLPSLKVEEEEEGKLERIILSDAVEREGKAFAISAAGQRLALCSPHQSSEWTLFGGGHQDAYETIVYSATHRRLFCVTAAFRLEAWDVAGELPSLDWATRFEVPGRPGLDSLIYVVCWEEKIFVVVRHVDPTVYSGRDNPADNSSSPKCSTVGFEVYEADCVGVGQRALDSLGGVAMFVGMNHPFALKGVKGVRPNCIYYGFDKRVKTLHPWTQSCAVFDCGIFDYDKGQLCRHWRASQLGFEAERPMWFDLPRHHNININI